MSVHEMAKEMAATAASNPAVAASVSVATTVLSAAARGDLVHGILVDVSMLAGVIVTLLLGRVHWIRYRLLKRQWDKPDGTLPKDV